MSRGRSRCPECQTRSSWNKLQTNQGCCLVCGYDMGLASFRKQLREGRYSFTNDVLDRMYIICKEYSISGNDLIDLAIRSKLTTWENEPKSVRSDLIMRKLSK